MTFLEELEPADHEAFLALAAPRRFAAGMTIFRAGDDAGSVMVVRAGHSKVTAMAPDGHEIVLGVRGPGELLGELSAIEGSERSASVTALEAAENARRATAPPRPRSRTLRPRAVRNERLIARVLSWRPATEHPQR